MKFSLISEIQAVKKLKTTFEATNVETPSCLLKTKYWSLSKVWNQHETTLNCGSISSELRLPPSNSKPGTKEVLPGMPGMKISRWGDKERPRKLLT